MDVTASMVKELREKTGAGILDAKKALVENNGDMEKAIEFLRQKGMASADKKMGRIAAEGIVTSYIENGVGAVLEVNCETDFVAKNADFQELVNNIAKQIVAKKPATVEELNSSVCPVCGKTIEEIVKEKIATIGEKITIRRFEILEGNLAKYVHNNKIAVLLKTSAANEELSKDICLHIASSAPDFVSRKEIPQSVIDEGRINKLMASRCLLEQPFVKNPDETVEKLIEGKLEVESFIRYTLGEGLEKRKDNFAEEVASQMKG